MLLFAFPFVFIGAFQLVLITLSNSTVIGADMFTNIFTTNASEAGDVLGTLIKTLVMMFLLYGGAYLLSYFSIKSKNVRSKRFYNNIIVSAPIMFVVGLIFVAVSYNKNPLYSAVQDIFPINVVNNFRVSILRWQMSKAYPTTSKEFRFEASVPTKEQREIYILVVGESGRADRWQLYGYNRETTPRLHEKGEQIIKMSDAVTESNTTHKSTALIMSSVSAVNFQKVYSQKSIVSAFNEVGFKTFFISNQGANGSFMDFYASEATERVDMPSRKAENGMVISYDGDMLPIVKKYIEQSDDNILIVIHSYGSHLQYHDRYTKEFEKFTPASAKTIQGGDYAPLNNAYDNTILYTDYFLSEIINIADSANVCAAMLYVSDHGEDLMDDSRRRFLHSSPTLTYYQLHIPYILWFSEEYKNIYAKKCDNAHRNSKKAVNTCSVFHTTLDMANIKTSFLNESESIVSHEFKEGPRMFLDDLYTPIYFGNTGLHPMDFEMIMKKNIKIDMKLIKKY